MILFYLACVAALLFLATAIVFALLWHNALRKLAEREKKAYARGTTAGALAPRRGWE